MSTKKYLEAQEEAKQAIKDEYEALRKNDKFGAAKARRKYNQAANRMFKASDTIPKADIPFLTG